MGKMKAPGLVTGLLIVLLASSVGNAVLYRMVNRLEIENQRIDRRLMVFANTTAVIAKEGTISRNDVLRSGMVGYPPYEVGTYYLIDYDEHVEGGIVFKFDAKNKLIAWQEYPASKGRKHAN